MNVSPPRFGETLILGGPVFGGYVTSYNGYNHITSVGGTVPTYDASGNILTINTGTLQTYTWNAENRVNGINGTTLTYDAFDRVVEKNATTQILYGPTGKLAVMNGQTPTRVYLRLPKGATVAYDSTQPSSPIFVHPDLMGNGVVGTDYAQNKVFDRSFAPYGEMYNNTTFNNYNSETASFTGSTQDLDLNLFDTDAREESFIQGRWINPDPSGLAASSLKDPQSLNRYSYVRNSAMGMSDPSGLGAVGVNSFDWYQPEAIAGGGGGDVGGLRQPDMNDGGFGGEFAGSVWDFNFGRGVFIVHQ